LPAAKLIQNKQMPFSGNDYKYFEERKEKGIQMEKSVLYLIV